MKSYIEEIISLFFEKRETRTHSKPISIVFLTLYSLLLLLSIINLLGLYEHKTIVNNVYFVLALFVVKLIDFIISRKK